MSLRKKKSDIKFVFVAKNAKGREIARTEGFLDQERCRGHDTVTGARCTRITIIGIGYCPEHLEKCMHLKIEKEEDYGLGLRAFDSSRSEKAILFRKGDVITPYDGEYVTRETVSKRYGESVAPYVLDLLRNGREGFLMDAAFHRGIGSIANHSAFSKSNAKFLMRDAGKGFAEPCIVASRDICNGTFIHACYGFTFRRGKGPDRTTYEHSTSKDL